MTTTVERQPSAKMIAGRELRLLAEHHLEVFQTLEILAQSAIAHRGPGFILIPALGIAQPDPARLGKVRCQRHVQQTALPVSPDLRYARDRRREAFVALPELEFAAAQGNQNTAIVRQEGQRPRVFELVLQHLHALPGGKDGSG